MDGLPINGNANQYKARQIETKNTEKAHQTAHKVGGLPLDGVGPGHLQWHQEEGDQKISNGQVHQHDVNARARSAQAPLCQ